jgi:tRNA pseudouridine55 synthase
MFHGILNVDKPAGVTSAYVVNGVKRLLPRKTKVGHAGTLDPFATGVLLILVGSATKASDRLMADRKGYEATIKFGARTPTDDLEAPEEPVDVARVPSEAEVRDAAGRFVGEIEQRPPAFSALKVDGQRAYKLARRGNLVDFPARVVQVYSLRVLEYAWPIARIDVECGKGTYIRALARDIGDALGVGGHLTALRRTFVGPYRAEDAVTPQTLKAEGVERHLRAI